MRERGKVEIEQMKLPNPTGRLYRWAKLIRGKGFELESPKNQKGEEVVEPTLFDIANEIESFIDGTSVGNL